MPNKLLDLVQGGGGGMPTGAYSWEPVDAIPEGAIACFGTSLLRADFPELFAKIGTTYGADDDDHFNVPDARGRFTMCPSDPTTAGEKRDGRLGSHRHYQSGTCGAGWCGHYGSNRIARSYTNNVETTGDLAPYNVSAVLCIWI